MDKNQLNKIIMAGWRPFLIWILILSLVLNFIVIPTINSFGYSIPTIDIQGAISMLTTLGVLAGLRTVEKIGHTDTKEIFNTSIKEDIEAGKKKNTEINTTKDI